MTAKKLIIRAVSTMLSVCLTFTCSFAFATDSLAGDVSSDEGTVQSESITNNDEAEIKEEQLKETDMGDTLSSSDGLNNEGNGNGQELKTEDESFESSSLPEMNKPDNEENINQTEGNYDTTSPLPIDENGFITVTVEESDNIRERKLPSDDNFTELNSPGQHPSLIKTDLENAIAIKQNARLAGEISTIENTINEADGMDVYYPLDIGSGLIVRFVMECPDDPSLDYDLHLYQYDESTGDLTWVDSSTYETYFNTDSHGKRKTLDESLSKINNSNATVTYALAVSAKVGYSTTKPYKLHMQVATTSSGSPEPNDSAFYTDQSPLGPGSPLSNRELDASMDQDWYRVGILSTLDKDYDYIDVCASKQGSDIFFDVEIYQADGQKMCLVNPIESTETSDKYELGLGFYYVRVYNYQFKSSGLTGFYDINFDKKGYLHGFKVKLLVDIDPPIQTGYPHGINYWFEDTFTAEVNAYDQWNNPVANEPVTVKWMSRMWPQNPEREVTLTGLTDEDGKCRLKFNPIVEPGTFEHTITNGYISFTHRYAIDDLYIQCGELSISPWIYHFFLSTSNM